MGIGLTSRPEPPPALFGTQVGKNSRQVQIQIINQAIWQNICMICILTQSLKSEKKLISSCNLEVKRIKYVFLTVFLLPRMRHDGIRCARVFRTGQQAPIPILGCGPTVWLCLSVRNTSSMGAYTRTQFPLKKKTKAFEVC